MLRYNEMLFTKMREKFAAAGRSPPVLTPEETAKALGVPLSTLDTMTRATLIQATVVAGRRVFSEKEVRRVQRG